ncbi:MAG TPA: hypothetical protein VLL28_04970, partial [Hyphomicrobiaceae bacterium]|nr:hypothetical protein [Hyphomicrobiaceae bacterium]
LDGAVIRKAVRHRHVREPGRAQKLSTPLYGGSNKGGDRQAIVARERAKLEAYNAELAAKGCKTVDIEAELSRPAEPPKKY